MRTSRAPSASDGADNHADWLEMRALAAPDGNSSLQDLVQLIRRTGTIEAVEPDEDLADHVDTGAEKTQAVAEDAFTAIEDRLASCGGDNGAYPFRVYTRYIDVVAIPHESPYSFLLLLSSFGKDAGPKGTDGARLFERLCVHAAHSYFGGSLSDVGSYHFGAPRQCTPRRFVNALDDMCRRMGEGEGCRRARTNITHKKDAGLDLSVWRSFPDDRSGKLTGFGQCATGANWRDKLTELQPRSFCEMWMIDTPVVPPVRLFFVPFRVEMNCWADAARRGGILFDRCRVALHSPGAPSELLKDCARWAKYVVKEQVES